MECTVSTLVELFDQQREQLRLRLGEHPDSEHTVREVKTCLGTLLTAYGQEKDHPLTERRLCGFLFDAVAAAVAPLAGCEIVADQHKGIALMPSSSRSTERGRWLLRGVYVVIAVALAGMLFQGGALTALALLGALVLLSVREWFSPASPPAASALQPTPHFRIVVDVNTLLVTLREAMKAVDMVMVEASKPPPIAASALEEDGTLLDLIHELLRAAYAEDGVYALKHLNS